MRSRAPFALAKLLMACCLGAAAAGCAGSQQEQPSAYAGLNCVDDSMDCVSRRKATLKVLIDDPSRAWIKEQPSPEAYASGVRLFAYKNKKKDLSCEELVHARKETDHAPAALASAGNLLTPAQVSRGRLLASEVGRELNAEHARRCKKA